MYLREMVELDDGRWVAFIYPESAKEMTAQRIIECFERFHRWDHRTARGIGGADHPTNLAPLERYTHEAVKTPRDLAAIAKAKRLSAAQEETRRKILAKTTGERLPERKACWKPLPGTIASGWRHRMSGKWERR